MRNANRVLMALVVLALGVGAGVAAMAASRAQSAGPLPVTLVAPDGWFASADGTVIAEVEADLSAAIPSGPRAQVVGVPSTKLGLKPLVKRFKNAGGSDPELVDGPTDVTLGSRESLTGTVITLSVTVQGERLVRRYVIVNPPGETPALVVLEAPEAQWTEAVDALMTALNE
ncbi:MAG: hypothetical protein WD598_12110 [Acidimicrobiia bacterium]